MPIILAKSSSGGAYNVRLDLVNDRVIAICACPAGEQRQLCKHLVAFLSADCSMLFQPDQEPMLLSALETFDATGLLDSHKELQAQLTQLDNELTTVKKRIDKERKNLKKAFMRRLTGE